MAIYYLSRDTYRLFFNDIANVFTYIADDDGTNGKEIIIFGAEDVILKTRYNDKALCMNYDGKAESRWIFSVSRVQDQCAIANLLYDIEELLLRAASTVVINQKPVEYSSGIEI